MAAHRNIDVAVLMGVLQVEPLCLDAWIGISFIAEPRRMPVFAGDISDIQCHQGFYSEHSLELLRLA